MLSVAILVFTDKEVWRDAESLRRPRQAAGDESGSQLRAGPAHTWLLWPNSLEMHINAHCKKVLWFLLCLTDQTSTRCV